MAPRLNEKEHKILPILLQLLLFAALAPFVWAFVLLRLDLPLGGVWSAEDLINTAALITGALVLLAGLFRVGERFLLPWGKGWKGLLGAAALGGAAFTLGFYFDISMDILGRSIRLPPLVGFPLILFFKLGTGAVFAIIVLACTKALRDMKGIGKVNWVQMLALVVALNLVTALYAFTSETVYVWDNAGYWAIARTLAQTDKVTYESILDVLRTTITLDYNHLLAFPISLVMRVFGTSRTVFTFAVSNLYILPGLWGFTAMAKEKGWTGLIPAQLFPMLTYTGLVGFVDVFCCGLGIWAFAIYNSDRPAASRGILSGLLLVLTFLFRRYFLFFAASFGVAALVQKLFREPKHWGDFFSLFLSCAVCAVTFTYPFLLDKVLGTDYGDIYSAYKSPITSDLLLFCRYFGAILLVIVIGGVLYGLVKSSERYKLVMGVVQIGVCFAAFVSIQSHGQQHLLMYLPAIAMLTMTVFSMAPQFWSALFAMVMTVNCFIPKAQLGTVVTGTFPDLFPSFHYYGPKRSDIDELIRLADFLDSLSTEDEPKSAVVLASSFTFNTETISSLRSSLDLPEPEVTTRIQYHGTVDKRDPFNWNSVTADYLVVGVPVQVHLGEENQQVMALLAHHVLDGTGPGQAYRELPEKFHLANGVTVRIFERTRPWWLEEYYDISKPLQEMYPDHAEMYEIPYWIE